MPSQFMGFPNSSCVRLIACQGSVQLATAIAALETHASRHKQRSARNYLLVHHLSAPAGQDADFADCIATLARKAIELEDVVYLDPKFTSELLNLWNKQSPTAACAALRSRLGVDHVDELHLGQNINFEHRLLADSYPQAQRIACGDGIGLNFTRNYFRPAPPTSAEPRTLRTWWRKVRKSLKRRLAPPTIQDPLAAVVPDQRYLLLANLFDEVATEYEAIPAASLREVFEKFSHFSGLVDSPDVRQAQHEIDKAEKAVVLLSSNFAETKRMSEEGEVESYCELIAEATIDRRSTAVVIKPHPRDSHKKMESLRQRLLASYGSVTMLGEAITFYTPFESIVAHYTRTIPRFVEKTTAVCVSSSCLGLEYLYGCSTVLGLGEHRVKKHFAPLWQPLRLRHEQDLVAATKHVRQLQPTRRAA